MRTHDIFFFGSFFFLLGILAASLGWKREILIIVSTGFAIGVVFAFFSKRKRFFILLTFLLLFIIPGALYLKANEEKKEQISIPFNQKITFSGKVASNPTKKEREEFKLTLLPPHKGNISVQTSLYPEYAFGETLVFMGTIQKTKGNYGSYLENTKDIRGISYFPKLEKREYRPALRARLPALHAQAWQAGLFAIKKHFIESFQKTLPYTEAAFLGGITLGEREEFSEGFKDAMSKSGTTHLVALSGYNITIIINIIAGTLVSIVSRKKAFWGTLIGVLMFVLMTGGEASVVRAAIMGLLAAIAPFVGRIYAPRNSIIFAALGMVIWNPSILLHDLGFQLSFLALLGIVYLSPALTRLFRVKDKGFLNWKENLMLTLSAQLMVTPFLVAVFGSVSATSLLSNILILELIPFTMFLGFTLGFVRLVSQALATLIAWITLIPLKIELSIIKLFSVLTIPLTPVFTIGGVALYYLAIIVFIWRSTKFQTQVYEI